MSQQSRSLGGSRRLLVSWAFYTFIRQQQEKLQKEREKDIRLCLHSNEAHFNSRLFVCDSEFDDGRASFET